MFPEDMTEVHQGTDNLHAIELSSRGKGSSWPWAGTELGDVQTNITDSRPLYHWFGTRRMSLCQPFHSDMEDGFIMNVPPCAHLQGSGSHRSTWPGWDCSTVGALDEHFVSFSTLGIHSMAPDQIKPSKHAQGEWKGLAAAKSLHVSAPTKPCWLLVQTQPRRRVSWD